MNWLCLLAKVEGKLSDWARRILRKKGKRKAKVQKCHQIWFAVRLISHCIVLSSKSHLIELENTCENTVSAESFRNSSQWLGYGQSLAVGWNHSVPIFLCHWGLICPMSIGWRSSLCPFLTPCLWHFWSSISVFSAHAILCSCFPVQVQRSSVQQRPLSQPEHVRITASTRRMLVLFSPHKTSCLLPSGLLTAQWRRAVEYGQIKQRRFALVTVRWGSHPWLMGLWPSQIALVQKEKQHNFVFFCEEDRKSDEFKKEE